METTTLLENLPKQDDHAKFLRMQEDIALISNLASHSLKSPLNILTNYCSMLEAKYHNQPLSEEKQWLSIMQQQTERMRDMVTALFDYLSIETSSNITRRPVNCNQLLQSVLTNLKITGVSASAVITYDNLPSVMGREKQISLIFAHLIDNALKFRHPDRAPVIHIGATLKGEMVEFAVTDNGIGIDENYQDIIFGLFQKLHPAEEYAGLGVGLGLCKKIIECSGGKIWMESLVDSENNSGTTFFFTLKNTIN
jgi:light-regulated signal transduction histidine kinase (bacteriophytochrome)